jgi:hypothetical protein
MSVNHVNSVGRTVPATTAPRNPDPAAPRTSEESSAAPVDQVTQQPVPPRFPWLSRLARELEPASKQPSPYGNVPLLGEKLDKQA